MILQQTFGVIKEKEHPKEHSPQLTQPIWMTDNQRKHKQIWAGPGPPSRLPWFPAASQDLLDSHPSVHASGLVQAKQLQEEKN